MNFYYTISYRHTTSLNIPCMVVTFVSYSYLSLLNRTSLGFFTYIETDKGLKYC